MRKKILVLLLLSISVLAYPQEKAFSDLLNDSVMQNAAISFYISDTDSNKVIYEFNSRQSLTPASIMKLVTTAAALELLGPDHKFRTGIGYTGKLNKRTGSLNGDIVIKGGGDPVLGSKEFAEHYAYFTEKWINEIKNTGIRKIEGRIITDDSYYDYQPVPAKWQWEDIGNYYGAGVYGLTVFDNYYDIHFRTSQDSTDYIITGIYPEECRTDLEYRLTVYGNEDEGYVFSAPYCNSGWIEGSIPSNHDDFILKASIPDPPLLIARIIDNKLRQAGVKIKQDPSTFRIENSVNEPVHQITFIDSPPLKDIIEVLNHESVNLYAEHILKELGKVFYKSGTASAGKVTILDFLDSAGIMHGGMFIEDGSGLSRSNAINASGMVDLLIFMKRNGKYFNDFTYSIPGPGEGTLKNYFKDDIFETRLIAKSGSMTRVRSYTGYLQTLSGRELAFCIIVNNFTGPSSKIVDHIEKILKEVILTK